MQHYQRVKDEHPVNASGGNTELLQVKTPRMLQIVEQDPIKDVVFQDSDIGKNSNPEENSCMENGRDHKKEFLIQELPPDSPDSMENREHKNVLDQDISQHVSEEDQCSSTDLEPTPKDKDQLCLLVSKEKGQWHVILLETSRLGELSKIIGCIQQPLGTSSSTHHSSSSLLDADHDHDSPQILQPLPRDRSASHDDCRHSKTPQLVQFKKGRPPPGIYLPLSAGEFILENGDAGLNLLSTATCNTSSLSDCIRLNSYESNHGQSSSENHKKKCASKKGKEKLT